MHRPSAGLTVPVHAINMPLVSRSADLSNSLRALYKSS
jgi:hypothetical protein